MEPRAGTLLIAILAIAAAGPAAAKPAKSAKPAPRHAAAPACDQACLDGLTDRYLDAMVARAPQTLPWAPVNRYSENNVPMMVGDGVWATITSHSSTPLRASDPKSGQVVWMGEIAEHGQPGFLALRLKVEGRKIAEAEAVIRRKGGPPQYGDPETYAHDPAFASSARASKRQDPKALVRVVDGYFDAVQGAKGAKASFAPGCARQDNGVATSSGASADGGVEGCAAQIRARVFKPIETVRARRYPIVDTARGVVIAAGFFDLPAAAPNPEPGKGLAWAADYPYSIGFISAFRIKDGGVWRVDTISNAQPYLMPSPWMK
jgi:hypothetical protein